MTPSPAKQPPSTVKAQEKKRKAVFKQLLDSPFNITWYPSTPPALTSGNPSISKQAMTPSTSYAGVPPNVFNLTSASSPRCLPTVPNPHPQTPENVNVQTPKYNIHSSSILPY